MIRPIASLAILLALAAPALAEDPAFTTLTACRLDPERIALTYAFDGGACQKVGEITAAEPRGTIAAVTIPTSRTSEMCTMQIVSIEGRAVLRLPEPVFDLDVEVLHPDNRVQAAGVIELDEDGECVEPAQ
jgi:hypothetical protein